MPKGDALSAVEESKAMAAAEEDDEAEAEAATYVGGPCTLFVGAIPTDVPAQRVKEDLRKALMPYGNAKGGSASWLGRAGAWMDVHFSIGPIITGQTSPIHELCLTYLTLSVSVSHTRNGNHGWARATLPTPDHARAAIDGLTGRLFIRTDPSMAPSVGRGSVAAREEVNPSTAGSLLISLSLGRRDTLFSKARPIHPGD